MNLLACPNKKCGGMLEFNYGNAYGNFYTCNVDLKQHILPTKKQIENNPERYIVETIGRGIKRVLYRSVKVQ